MADASPSSPALADAIKAEAARLGFALCGITTADPPPHHRHYARWLAEGKAGEMLYLGRQEPKRGDLSQVLPSAKSVVCVALNYSPEDGIPPAPNNGGAEKEPGAPPATSPPAPPLLGAGGVIARYARFDDYHETMWRRLDALLAFIQTQALGANGKVYCDTGPITERDLAMRAGLGWIGKHTNLISRRMGNWFFLGEILLDIALPPDAPETTHCGTCTRCLPACPTGAITAPYQLDARRCISYLTIELKGSIPIELRPLIGTRIYGCDDCLAVCPWNKFAVRADDPAVNPRADLTAPDLLELLALDDAAFRQKFRNSPIRRAKRRGLFRNVCVALGNLGDSRALPALERAAEHDPEPLVREHAAWAVERLRLTQAAPFVYNEPELVTVMAVGACGRPKETTRMAEVDFKELAAQLRVDSIRCTTAAGSGHPTSSMSAADLMAVLLGKYLHYDWSNPKSPTNDHLIFSKGHACPVLYSMFKAAGAISDEELLTLRKFGSRLEGHPNPHVTPYTDVATGSLGQGLPIGVGIALDGKYLDKLPFKVWVVLGDSEVAEGSIWEAVDKASHYKLNNLIAILDMNRLGQRGETDLGWNSAVYAARAAAFGAHTIEINGHDLDAIDKAYAEAVAVTDKPVWIIAKTEKGHGVSFTANKEGWHGKAMNAEQAADAIKELGGERHIVVPTLKPADGQPAAPAATQPLKLPTYDLGTKEATRKAYGDAITALGGFRADIVALDGEVSNSTHADEFNHAFPDRFFEMYIAEQQLVSAAVGMSVRGKRAFASTFAAFFSRAFDQIRMASISNATISLSGSHAGVSIGEDGPSQMALEDLAMMRAVFGSTVLYPSDPNQTARLVHLMADLPGISYIRTTREKLPILYGPDETYEVGGSKLVHHSDGDQVAIVAAGITLHEANKAYDRLKAEGISVRLIDAYSVKPIDKETLHRAAQDTGGKIVVVEDHWFEGGLGDAVLDAFVGVGDHAPTVVKLAVTHMPSSGKPAELLHAAKIDADAIVEAVKSLL